MRKDEFGWFLPSAELPVAQQEVSVSLFDDLFSFVLIQQFAVPHSFVESKMSLSPPSLLQLGEISSFEIRIEKQGAPPRIIRSEVTTEPPASSIDRRAIELGIVQPLSTIRATLVYSGRPPIVGDDNIDLVLPAPVVFPTDGAPFKFSMVISLSHSKVTKSDLFFPFFFTSSLVRPSITSPSGHPILSNLLTRPSTVTIAHPQTEAFRQLDLHIIATLTPQIPLPLTPLALPLYSGAWEEAPQLTPPRQTGLVALTLALLHRADQQSGRAIPTGVIQTPTLSVPGVPLEPPYGSPLPGISCGISVEFLIDAHLSGVAFAAAQRACCLALQAIPPTARGVHFNIFTYSATPEGDGVLTPLMGARPVPLTDATMPHAMRRLACLRPTLLARRVALPPAAPGRMPGDGGTRAGCPAAVGGGSVDGRLLPRRRDGGLDRGRWG
ncbi:hypothetical protein PAPYR_4227 [Paratrimastix pyriformis]|uniref:Uncharacterized protein n=1 Tax=Paratrimastix pyriformis TaxID=342808 RepID=A0ABQ8UKU9_9EUKA|nr:hypothetical protein PAPYR_4227 [Paratrimastix pyriformis]